MENKAATIACIGTHSINQKEDKIPMNIILVNDPSILDGTPGNDMIYVVGPSSFSISAGEGDDILLGGDQVIDIFGSDGNDTILGSHNDPGFGTYATDGVFDHQAAFLDDGYMQYLIGGIGDDLIYLGRSDVAYGGNDNDTFDARFMLSGSAYAYGGNGTDRMIANLEVGDTVTTGLSNLQYFSIGGHTVLETQSIEEVQFANASDMSGTGNFIYEFGTGSWLIGLTRQVSSADGVASGDVLIDAVTLVETNDSNGYGFSIISGDAKLHHNIFEVELDSVWSLHFDNATLNTRYGTVEITSLPDTVGPTISYTAGVLDLEAAINVGTRLNLGAGLLDTTLHLSNTYDSMAHIFIPQTVTTRVELFYTLPDALDLRGMAGLTHGAEIVTSVLGSTVFGSDLADLVQGLGGNDLIVGGKGMDSLQGGAGDDVIRGGGHHDLIYGGTGDDQLFGGVGNDTVEGRAGYDAIFGGAGADRLFGQQGNDALFGGMGNDKLFGGDGDDYLSGDTGTNTLKGGNGNDTIVAGDSYDWLFGGAGADVFVFAPEDSMQGSLHFIEDFTLGEDLLNVEFAWDPAATPTRADILMTATEDSTGVGLYFNLSAVVLTGLTLAELTVDTGWYQEPVSLPI